MNQLIKKVFDPGNYTTTINMLLLLVRLVVGIFMLTHGIGKMQALFSGEAIQFPDPMGVGATTSLALAVFSEVFCSVLIILGLGSRLAAIPLLITMLVAAFVVHINDGFGKQELPGLYAIIYLIIAVLGAGKYSIDYLISNKIKK